MLLGGSPAMTGRTRTYCTVTAVTAADFDLDGTADQVEDWLVKGHDDPDDGLRTAAANAVLWALGLERLGVRGALARLCDSVEAHLANPRFDINVEE
mmetsp:Transcript_25216/g.75929  ORF Transcript_25216/g.75929 Transcript_25216/m.75929 type:complete len:97 (-) Transcript_25216:273-563(-)